jgi:hypothetical protein
VAPTEGGGIGGESCARLLISGVEESGSLTGATLHSNLVASRHQFGYGVGNEGNASLA